MDKFKGRAGESYRVAILTTNACNAVFSDGAFVSSDGNEDAKLRFGSVIVKYEPTIDGWLVNIMPWFYGIKTFESINQTSLSHPKYKDLIVTCTQEDYQQFDIKLCPMCIWKSNTKDIDKIYRSLPTLWESTVSKLAKGFKTPGLTISNDSDRYWSELFPEKEGTSCA